MSDKRALDVLGARIEACVACPRLVRYRAKVAKEKRAAYKNEIYHGKPVRGFGDPDARIVVMGLAPGAHGANRTGRVFTGDRSGDFLYAALFRAGLASQPTSTNRSDGLRLTGVFVSVAGRCAPPDNRPTPKELVRCAHFIDEEMALLPNVRVILALGSIAFAAIFAHAVRTKLIEKMPRPKPTFKHGEAHALGKKILLASYHVSQQNTLTGVLTPAMFDAVIARAKVLAEYT
jgi:uracil-DNA glycosylase family 4